MGVIRYKGEYKTTEISREYDRIRVKRDMDLAIEYYSSGTNQCAVCGEHRREFLTLDHINANRKNWNKSIGLSENTGGTNLARGLRARKWPEGIQILCYNCNILKGSHITSRGKNLKDRSHLDINAVKTCNICGKEKNVLEFSLRKTNKHGVHTSCFDCERLDTARRNHMRKQKLITLLGGKCSCCGEDRIEYLSIEHANNDGVIHRLDIKQRYNLNSVLGSTAFIMYVLKDIAQGIIWPRLEVHCFNCNSSKGAHGYCPHEIDRGDIILDQYGNPIRLKERINNDI